MTKFVITGLFLCLLCSFEVVARQGGKSPQKQPSTLRPAAKPVVVKPANRPLPAQTFSDRKKYPSLLWEITGKGMRKPSYLFGTMHVSDKLAFHLGDIFYNAIRNADVVALETNPETWQDDYSASTLFGKAGSGNNRLPMGGDFEESADKLHITTFAIDGYEEAVRAALSVEPAMINNLLYRTYGGRNSDFEEDTFLDMYIFQVGKKLGKRLCGVENFEESEKLVMEAYKDMMRDKNKKRRSYDMEGQMINPKKIEDAYRRGDLDLLDSLEALSVMSDAFQEKFLYKRNEIQANSIDSIMRRNSLFVGVGAAHLPGKRGVIEMLREMGYTLRPVMMDDRNSAQKEAIDHRRIESSFVAQTAADGWYKVSIPGSKFYQFTEMSAMDVTQYADMINGAYYMVTRVKTNSLALGHSAETVSKKVDSLLYENIPGKLIRKTPISRNGYKGFDIVNRTRRGDYQRYNIYITPFELIIFKMSGNGEYVNKGTEATRFFQSVQLKEYNGTEWQHWQPATGGFSVQMPHVPVLLTDKNPGSGRMEYSAFDKQDGNSYLVMKTNLYNFSYIEEDSFELNLLDESYAFSSFIDKTLSRRLTTVNGYPALEAKYSHKDGSFSTVRYVIRGAVYHAAIARYQKENANVRRFLESFSMQPFIYPDVKDRVDTSLHYTVKSPVFPQEQKKTPLSGMDDLYDMVYEEMGEDGLSDVGEYKHTYIGNDTTGEKILVNYVRLSDNAWFKDSTIFWKSRFEEYWDEDSTFIGRYDRRYSLPTGMIVREKHYGDTNSSRLIQFKTFFKDNYLFSLSTLTDTLSRPSAFLQSFFSSFTPADTLKGSSIFERRSAQVLTNLFSSDSAAARKATRDILRVSLDSADMPRITKAIDALNWDHTEYLRTKKCLIGWLGTSKDTAVTNYLHKLYRKIKDTTDFQHVILGALTNQQTKFSYKAFKDLILQEPPITEGSEVDIVGVVPGWHTTIEPYAVTSPAIYDEAGAGGLYGLFDSLALTKTIMPDLLQLMHIDDYEWKIMTLMNTMIDSGYLKAADYETYFSKIYLDGKQLLKKQMAGEDKLKIERAGKKDTRSPILTFTYRNDDDDQEEKETGNYQLDQYAALLLPFKDKNPGVHDFFELILKTSDRRLLYNTFILLLRNKQPVPDSLFEKYARLDDYRSELYGDLKKMKLTDKFPAQYKSQLEMTRSLLTNAWGSYEKRDTVVFLDKLPVTYKNKKGWVYFYKYKKMRDDANWQLAAIGMQPENAAETDVENEEFNSVDERKLETDKPVNEQLAQMLREMLVSKRRSASEFYEGRNFRLYKGYMSEIVKSRRFRD
ncbi:TraB/GumN family protein [Paraflavitalea sp. CAU 1676]|uniref:TraB/GumN family protein n=1 Tax=Paraflavitalea sp. CAU 1676 TaxID=3032598 RepID=UPI0023DC63E4|nr:TraB/GumN family protein [Paraflavitalea sp. CAU 1676]MDF2189728.1 TraB/GumN family protein [Paraflavitalea sp. CAU 1676]